VFLLAILSLAAVPVIGVGCSDQGATNPAASGETKKESKPTSPKSPGRKPKSADESGSTTGSLGVKPPKTPATDTKK
jgi:hypothetical protein